MDALLELAAIYGRKQMIKIAKFFGYPLQSSHTSRTFETNIPTLIDEAVEWSDVVLSMNDVDEVVGGDAILEVMAMCMIMDPGERKGAEEILECEILRVDGRRMGRELLKGGAGLVH